MLTVFSGYLFSLINFLKLKSREKSAKTTPEDFREILPLKT